MPRTLVSSPSLEYHRKQAKALCRAHAAGNAEVLETIRSLHPRFAGRSREEVRLARFPLSDAQLVWAREHGLPSWPRLRSVVLSRGEAARRVEAFVEAASPPEDSNRAGGLEAARALLAADPGLPASDPFAAAVYGDAGALRRFLEDDPSLADARGGPRSWTPLLYLTFSRFLRIERERQPEFRSAARLLLDRGANPNAFWPHRFGGTTERETALYGAAGVANDPELTRMLLDAGADPNDDEVAYHSVEWDDTASLKVWWLRDAIERIHRTTALQHRLDYNHLEDIRWMLERGADPNALSQWGWRPLHMALSRGRAQPFIDLLLEHGADPNGRDSGGRTAFDLAARAGRADAMEAFRRHGAVEPAGRGDRLFVALASDDDAVRRVLAEQPDLVRSLAGEDALAIVRAAASGSREAVRRMLDAGFDIEAVGEWGGTPLHHACWHGQLETVRLLVERGASLAAVNVYGGTPLGTAVYGAGNNRTDIDYAPVVEVLLEAGADVREVGYPSGRESVDQVLRRFGAEAPDPPAE